MNAWFLTCEVHLYTAQFWGSLWLFAPWS